MQATMSMYEAAKQLLANEEPMDIIALNACISDIVKDTITNKYSMLLCHDRRDYTVFALDTTATREKLFKDMKEVLMNRGNLLTIEKQADGAWEIWIRDFETNENFVYYLFDYTNAVIEVN